jgi:hypothetical protein
MASITNAAGSFAANAVTVRCNSGTLRIYSGTPPANANASLSGNTLLANLSFGATAFAPAVNGVATANAITQDSSADATGTATFFRALESDGTTVVFQGSVGTSGAELNLSSVSIVAGGQVPVTSFTYTQALTS